MKMKNSRDVPPLGADNEEEMISLKTIAKYLLAATMVVAAILIWTTQKKAEKKLGQVLKEASFKYENIECAGVLSYDCYISVLSTTTTEGQYLSVKEVVVENIKNFQKIHSPNFSGETRLKFTGAGITYYSQSEDKTAEEIAMNNTIFKDSKVTFESLFKISKGVTKDISKLNVSLDLGKKVLFSLETDLFDVSNPQSARFENVDFGIVAKEKYAFYSVYSDVYKDQKIDSQKDEIDKKFTPDEFYLNFLGKDGVIALFFPKEAMDAIKKADMKSLKISLSNKDSMSISMLSAAAMAGKSTAEMLDVKVISE